MIIADTSPLNYLILIDEIDILPKLFSEVAIPVAVRNELLSTGANPIVQGWIEELPHWLIVRRPSHVDESINLGSGEAEAISLAMESADKLIALDDRAARETAKLKGLKVIGTLGILKLAADEKLIDLKDAVQKLRKTNFRVSETVIEHLLNR